MDRREAEALDRHITGNWGEDQFGDEMAWDNERTEDDAPFWMSIDERRAWALGYNEWLWALHHNPKLHQK